MTKRSLHDGRADGLTPLESLRLEQIGSFSDLLRAMGKTAFSGRQLGDAFDILTQVCQDQRCHLVLTISGAMTIAKQGGIICEMIDRGLVNSIVATGALIAHGLSESIGLTHYRCQPTDSDEELYQKGYNRVFDTLEMEANLDDVAELVGTVLDEQKPEGGVWSSSLLCREVGRRLSQLEREQGILRSAFEKNVPVYIPAFTDSEIGLDVSTWAMRKARDGGNTGDDPAALFQNVPTFNPYLDLQKYASCILAADDLAILTIGGGVPRNWAQQIAPYIEITNSRLNTDIAVPRFRHAVRICPEPVHWGGLSGCTYSEGVSWGKFLSPAEGGRFAEVYADATVVLPLLIKAVFEELDRHGE